jgi:hypothetical protein
LNSALPFVPDRLAKAFEGRTTLNLGEAARALEMDEKCLRAAVARGKVKYVLRGQGETRKLRRFLLPDLVDYLNAERRQECPSTSVPTRRSIGASSGSKVFDIADLRRKRRDAKLGSPRSA